ncbi:MAG: hypothetical protein E5V66_13965 [Mesorhizobium sp.]|nr:hypothetical protein EOA29_29770 [Mesorhizobium sp. M1E.F.Ca.ET.063.01.1.1]TIW11357.1 MAG: hypothetical protein E5V66_13965 [Mesorhizobium sp.]
MGTAAIAGAASVPSQAFASEWGCQVLLCLSGDWQGTPSCHPPIDRLIDAMGSPGFSWPICPQANSSGARYDPYEACPQGWTPYAPASDRPGQGQASMCRIAADNLGQPASFGPRHGQADGSASATIQLGGRTVPVQLTYVSSGAHNDRTTTYYDIQRARRAKPYYIDYDDTNGLRQRSWFNLSRP